MQDMNKNYTLQEDLAREKRMHSNKYFCISQKIFWKYNISRQMAQEKDGNNQRRYFKTTRYENCEKIQTWQNCKLQYGRWQNKYKLKYHQWCVADRGK